MSEGRTFLITGGSGFLGKVVLEELIRRRAELGVERILLVIRPQGARNAAARFRDEVMPAECFRGLPGGWEKSVRVLEGDLTEPGLQLDPRAFARLTSVTHIVHAAASVNFNLPVQVAAKANITATLNLLEVAHRCPLLERFVYVSTAYVTPHRGDTTPVEERLVSLPVTADALFAAITAGVVPEQELLRRTGHPNTYTFTKALAEHLVVERAGTIPVSIVRPSIITASRQWPFPGWIDSTSGFGAFAMLIGLGQLRAVIGRPNARLDLIPVDEVSTRVINEAVAGAPSGTVRHATAGIALTATTGRSFGGIQRYFRAHPIERRPPWGYLGPTGLRFWVAEAVFHRLPVALARFGGPVQQRQAKKLSTRRAYLNEVFPYFTTRSFDFRSSVPLLPAFDAEAFVAVVCRGVARHLLRQNEREWILAGGDHPGHGGDLRWAIRQPRGNAFVRFGCWASTKLLRRVADRVTVDLPSFEQAVAAAPRDTAIVLLPSHRSYLDFILVSYLAFARPDLGIRIPHIAAAMEFGRLPLLGRLMRAVHAFYVQRGPARENRVLEQQVHALLKRGEVLEFFIEGARSRSRAFLPPKRGLLRLVQSSGTPTLLLPIAISYDRVPEEDAFRRELSGAPRPRMRLGALFGWLAQVWRREVRLGRMHMACGEPILLRAESDVSQVARQAIEQMRAATTVSTFHLEVLAADPAVGKTSTSLIEAFEARGGRVLESTLRAAPAIDPLIAATIREQCEQVIGPMEAPTAWGRGMQQSVG